jgi:hypothetical protein
MRRLRAAVNSLAAPAQNRNMAAIVVVSTFDPRQNALQGRTRQGRN